MGSETAVNSVVNGRPLWQLPYVFPLSGFTASTGGDFAGINPNLRIPYVQQANLTWEHQFSPGTGLRISGVNTHGTQLVWDRDLNQLAPQNIPLGDAGRMFPGLGAVTYQDNGANSIYYGLNVTLTRTWTRGLQYESTWTWAHNITDNDNDWQGGGLASNAYNRRYDRGNVSFTVRHRLVNSFIWGLPVGQGHRFMDQSPKWLNAMFGGWQLTGVNIIQTGQYFTPLVDYSVYGIDLGLTDGNTIGRPDALANGNLPGGQRSITQWFNTGLRERSFLNLAAANARCANAKPLPRAVHERMHPLKIQIPTALTDVVGMADAIPKLRPTTAHFTDFCHRRHTPAAYIPNGPKLHSSKGVFNILTSRPSNLQTRKSLSFSYTPGIHTRHVPLAVADFPRPSARCARCPPHFRARSPPATCPPSSFECQCHQPPGLRGLVSPSNTPAEHHPENSVFDTPSRAPGAALSLLQSIFRSMDKPL